MGHAGSHWGECKDCKMWQIEPDASLADNTMGLCIHHDLKTYDLRVSGNSGCDSFAPGKPARAEGAGAVPGEKG
ncbi:hypothetical protein [Aquisphaera insulae]|uniref:hypothetical protein n=1 Tax=Aquisphaera insulae TaxID=2712864 RepID=UPI0013E9FD5D|nr:hypothetical protein [Aquisphaera insulae]